MISIIVPVYNAEKYIRTTIEMVKKQTYRDWELILVDDGSKDRSPEIITECMKRDPEKIRFIQKPVNEGAAKARNTGIDAANGRYIAFLDADDIWYAEKLEKELAFMEKHDAAFVFSSYEFGDENGIPTGKAVHVPKVLTYKEALSRTVIFTSTVLLDTEKIRKELIHMPVIGSEDTATWWQILKEGVTAYGLDELLAVYRRPARSLSSNKGIAIKRIWNLYRTVAEMSVMTSFLYLLRWAWKATVRRVVADTIRNHVESIKRFAVIELSFVGLILQTGLFAYAWFSRYYPVISSFRVSQEGFAFGSGLKLYFRGHLLVLLIYFVILLFLTKISKGMKTGYLKPGSIFASQTTALIITNIITYFQISLMRNWLVPVKYTVILTLIQIVFAGMWAVASDWFYRAVFPPVETLVIQGEKKLDSVVRVFNTRQDRFKVMRTLQAGNDLQEIKEECLRWYGAVIMGPMEEGIRRELLEFCFSHHIRVYFLPDVADILIHGSEAMDLFDIPILELKEYSISWEKRLFKRFTDLILSGCLLVILFPVLLCRGIYGKIKYGKIFTKEICVTKSKKKFTLHTFETDRIKKTKIDCIPMLWDVFRGKMSMVGPKPLSAQEMEDLIADDYRYFYRLRVKAGLTGNAQICGKPTTDRKDLLKLDLIYIQHFSILQDLKLLLLSVKR